MKAVWARDYQSFYDLRDVINQERGQFTDMDALGVFTDNHDNERFLHIKSDHKALQASLVFSIFAQGIPMVYYGSEQNFGGGDDPKNREQLWTNFDTSTDTYQILANSNRVRKDYKAWSEPHVERYVDTHFYAFTRGDVLVAVTNSHDSQSYSIDFHEFSEGTLLCNQLKDSDCVSVDGGSIKINLNDHESKVYVP